jgi:outer membrane lipoprotein carrier protein
VIRSGIVAIFSVSLCAGSRSAEEIAAQVESHYNQARTLSVKFFEAYEVQGHKRPTESGTLRLQKTGKMRWDYERPAGKLFLSDGKNIYLYTSGDNRVEKIRIRDTEDMRAPFAFLLGHLDFKKQFRDFRERTEEGGEWLDASPKTDRAPYERVEMLVATSGSIRRLKILGKDGSLTSFAFSDEMLNLQIDDKLFHFTVPPGAEVVDAVEFGSEGN